MPTPSDPPDAQADPSDPRRVEPGDACVHVMYLDQLGYEQKMTSHLSQPLEDVLADLDRLKLAITGAVHALGGTILAIQLEILTTQPVLAVQEGAQVIPLRRRESPAECG